jgi:hypothetical protein
MEGQTADTAHEASKTRGRPRLLTWVQGIVVTILVATLAFIVISNYAGWTAVVEVTAVKRDCERADCRQRVFVRGRGQPFSVSGERQVKVGDRARVHGKCTPRCKLDLVAFTKAPALN